MPTRHSKTQLGTHQAMKNTSYESLVVSWLMQDGWQVFIPVLDHGHQTDILISDGEQYYRIQIKSFNDTGSEHILENKWRNSNVDVVVYFARNSNWGVITPAFRESKRKINHKSHRKFISGRKNFLKEFHKI